LEENKKIINQLFKKLEKMKATIIQNSITNEIICYKINDKKVSINTYHDKINYFLFWKNQIPMQITRRDKKGNFKHESYYSN